MKRVWLILLIGPLLVTFSSVGVAKDPGKFTLSSSVVLKPPTEVLAWSWGAASTGILGTPGPVFIQDISITREVDELSPVLMDALLSSTVLVDMVISSKDMKITIENALITSFSTGAGDAGDTKGPQTENITLNVCNVQFEAHGVQQSEVFAACTP